MVGSPFLSLRNVGTSVRTATGASVSILRHASLEVREGETIAIIGPSGGGKSTLMKAILGLVPFTEGMLTYKDQLIQRPLDAAHQRLRTNAEAVLQNPLAALNPYASLRVTMTEPLRSRGMAPQDCDVLIEETAARMGLPRELLDRRPSSVSLGQAQRACIARAFAPRPELLFLDEPLSALDALVASEVAALLIDVIQETRPTILFVSHDMRLVRHLASRVVVIDAGEIVEDATTDQLLHNPESQAARSIVESDRRRQAIFAEARGLIGMIA